MKNLKKKTYDYFERLLKQQLEELLNQAEQTVSVFIQGIDISADPLEQAAIDWDRNRTLRFRDRESRLIKKIQTALEKIESGEFGICEMCGEEIPLARLKARPVTSYCIQCKSRMETLEKASGL